MIVIAHTPEKIIEVQEISVYIADDKGASMRHNPNEKSIRALIDKAKSTGVMQIYDAGMFEGKIDAFDDKPLNLYGQLRVVRLDVDGEIVWQSEPEFEKQLK